MHDSSTTDDHSGGSPTSPTAFRFQVPPEFQTVPLGIGEDEDAFGEQLRSFARDYWGERGDLEQLHRLTKAMYAANAETLVAGGAVHNALGIFPVGGSSDGSQPPERVSRATLTVSVRELGNPDPHVTAAGIAESLDHAAGDGNEGETQLVTLPAGPAVVRIAGSRAVWELPDGEQERFFVRIEVWLPFPGEDRLLLFCLSTADVQDLYLHQAVLADIADTVEFGETDGPGEADVAPSVSPFSSY
ncbi:hypothetical protein [Streptomyces sp. JH34]|uniref:hypothetical protein n=1 Tax=Streptomyces sp. JH34 TaxID=2793633 RepID=UPI0023F7433A|nr:hypothetical protein [Streptomyces sp. JH34]MDF6023089.1 hypothetical protein [Streptomyces sp. JH34]